MLALFVTFAYGQTVVWTQQAPSGDLRPVFEVASIRENRAADARFSIQLNPGGVRMSGATAIDMIGWAFDVRGRDIVAEQSWVRSLRFDVEAKSTATLTTSADQRELVKGVLRGRFQLNAELEKQSRPIYALVLARTDRRFGPRLTRSASDECRQIAAQIEQNKGNPLNPAPAAQRKPGESGCGVGMLTGNGYQILAIGGREATMNQIASSMSRNMDRPVIDQTGLDGFFDFVVAPTGSVGTPLDAAAAFFTLFQEQLGLRLKPDRSEVDVLVIRGISRPAEN
jgi:uncharacterized protein (TIGR03435 family)